MPRVRILRFSVGLRCALGVALLAVGGVVGVGCSEQERAKPTSSSAGTAGHAGKSTNTGGETASSAGGAGAANTIGGASDGGISTEGGAPGVGAAGDSTAGPPGVAGDPGLMLEPCASDATQQPSDFAGVCTANKGWATGTDLAATSGDAPAFLAVVPSELTLLWSEPQSSNFAYFVADRETTSDAFGEPQELPFTNVLGLSPDGLRLTLQASDGTLLEATREQRGDAFGEAEAGTYTTLNANAQAAHLVLGDVAISPDDGTLFYSAWSLEDLTPYPLRTSTRVDGNPWPVGVVLEACALKSYGAFGPQPTAVSSDGLTLFYFDAARGTARAAFRSAPAAAFTWFVDVPDVVRPQPNAACDRLYFSPKQGNARLLSATRKP